MTSLQTTMLAVLISACFSAHATGPQAVTSSVVNHGTINNTVTTSASTVGVGTSYSSATGASSAASTAAATAEINPVTTANSRSGAIGGGATSALSNQATAFNVSTGAGTGAASSVGSATADSATRAGYTGPGQWVRASGSTDSNSSVSVNAARNEGGVSNAGVTSALTMQGTVGSTICTTGSCAGSTSKQVWGSVQDTKLQPVL